MRYGPKVKAEIHKEFVEGKPATVISKEFRNKPTAQQILNWAHAKDRETGKNWFDEKRDYELEQYEGLSPQTQAQKILKKIDRLISKSDKSFTTKDADALSKLQKLMEKLIDKKFQLPTMYHLLTRFMEFISLHYKKLLTKELINAIRHFKNSLKEEFENVN